MGLNLNVNVDEIVVPKSVREGIIFIEDACIEVAILNNGVAVITVRSLYKLFGKNHKGNLTNNGLPSLISSKRLEPFISNRLYKLLTTDKVTYINKQNKVIESYNVAVVPQICHAYVKASLSSVNLTASQWTTTYRAELIYLALGELGIVGLINEKLSDEQTNKPLEDLLLEVFSKAPVPRLNAYASEFFSEIYHLKGWEYDEKNILNEKYLEELKATVYDLIYARIDDEVFKQFGDAKEHGIEMISADLLHPRLNTHLATVVAYMNVSETYQDLLKLMDTAFPVITAY